MAQAFNHPSPQNQQQTAPINMSGQAEQRDTKKIRIEEAEERHRNAEIAAVLAVHVPPWWEEAVQGFTDEVPAPLMGSHVSGEEDEADDRDDDFVSFESPQVGTSQAGTSVIRRQLQMKEYNAIRRAERFANIRGSALQSAGMSPSSDNKEAAIKVTKALTNSGGYSRLEYEVNNSSYAVTVNIKPADLQRAVVYCHSKDISVGDFVKPVLYKLVSQPILSEHLTRLLQQTKIHPLPKSDLA